MIAPQLAREVKKRIEEANTPVVSLYLDVNPANPENERRGFIIRAKDAMRQAGVPKDLARQVEENLSRTETKPQGRTLVMFLSEDQSTVAERFHLQVDLPLLGPIRGAVARWGRPHVTPLLLALEDHHHYGVLHISAESWRLFESYLGEIEEVEDAFRDLDLEEWREMTEGATVQPYIAARGGQGKERFERRVDERTHRLYNEAASVLERELKRREIRRLIVLGPQEQAKHFVENLPQHIAGLVVGTGRNVDAPEPRPDQILAAAQPVVAAHEGDEARSVLDSIRERGVTGRQAVVEALREGRLQLLALPWNSPDLDQELYRCPLDGSFYASRELADAGCTDGEIETLRLGDAVPDLAAANGARVTFLTGDSRGDLIDEFGGMAGLPRWKTS